MKLVALGDSFTCGEGVGVRVPSPDTWSALLARSLDAGHLSLATPGARVRDVLREQLSEVEKADVATVLVGLNDVARSGFDLDRIAADLATLAAGLQARARTVVVGRLHDPTRMLWFPAPLRRIGQERVARINRVIDVLRGVHVLDTGVPEWQHAGSWDVDRVHPSAVGHRALARAAGLLLRDLGHQVELGPPVVVPRGRSLPARAVWAARHGMPYVAGHLTELATPAWEALGATSG